MYSPCQLQCVDEGETKYFIKLKISEHGVVVHYSERMQVFGVNMHIKDIYHVSTIKEVCTYIAIETNVTCNICQHIMNVFIKSLILMYVRIY